MVGITLNASVTPAKPGFTLTLWVYDESSEEWTTLIDRTTDSAGKVRFAGWTFPSYPQTMRVTLHAGQVIEGIEYGGYTTPDLILRDVIEYNISLFPEAVEEPTVEKDYGMFGEYNVWYIPEYTRPYLVWYGHRYDADSVLVAMYATLAEAMELVGEEPVEPPPEPPPGDYLAEVYRTVEIWWIDSLNMFRAQVDVGYVAVAETLPLIKPLIDEILAFLYPPEDPEEGLFAQIVAAVQVWVLDNMPAWVLEWGSIVNNYLTEVYETITNVYNTFEEYITNVYNTTKEYITNVYNDFNDYITNVYNYVTEEITNIYNTTNEYVTNIIGASVEWVEERLADNRAWMENFAVLMDPVGFLKDPLGFINAAFGIQRVLAETLVIKSFLEGFEEGLAE